MAAFPHPNSFSSAARDRIWAQMQTEAEERLLHGKLISGSGVGQSFSRQPLTNAEFFAIFNEWSGIILGSNADSGGITQIRPDFSRCR